MIRTGKPKLRWFQFRLSGLLWFTVLCALLCSVCFSPLRMRVAEMIHPIPDDMVEYSWTSTHVANGEDRIAWVVTVKWCAERPFYIELVRRNYGESVDSPVAGTIRVQVDSRMIFSDAQLVGHNAVARIEFRYSRGCLTVSDATSKKEVLWKVKIEDPGIFTCMGTSARRLPLGGTISGGYLGGGAGFRLVAFGRPIAPGADCLEEISFSHGFVEEYH